MNNSVDLFPAVRFSHLTITFTKNFDKILQIFVDYLKNNDSKKHAFFKIFIQDWLKTENGCILRLNE